MSQEIGAKILMNNDLTLKLMTIRETLDMFEQVANNQGFNEDDFYYVLRALEAVDTVLDYETDRQFEAKFGEEEP